ncbi:MAG: sodium-anion symporter, partial [Caldilineaceae bacterium]|nr:sodium-anion symporter [Caldilineaceae bacterium]
MTLRRSRLKSDLPTTATLSSSQGQDEREPEEIGPEPEERDAADVKQEPARPRRSTARRTMTSKRRIQRRATPLEVLQLPIQA